MGLRKSLQKKKSAKKKSTRDNPHRIFYHSGAFYESIETLGAFFVDFLKSISSNKEQSKTGKTQRKIKSGKNSILELFYMYPIFGGFATQKIIDKSLRTRLIDRGQRRIPGAKSCTRTSLYVDRIVIYEQRRAKD
jgi:hypothetical protein